MNCGERVTYSIYRVDGFRVGVEERTSKSWLTCDEGGREEKGRQLRLERARKESFRGDEPSRQAFWIVMEDMLREIRTKKEACWGWR